MKNKKNKNYIKVRDEITRLEHFNHACTFHESKKEKKKRRSSKEKKKKKKEIKEFY